MLKNLLILGVIVVFHSIFYDITVAGKDSSHLDEAKRVEEDKKPLIMLPPTEISRGKDWIQYSWDAPLNLDETKLIEPVYYELIMNDVTIYSGTEKSHLILDLSDKQCYFLKATAFVNGEFVSPSEPMKITPWVPRDKSEDEEEVYNPQSIAPQMEALREKIMKEATSPPKDKPCEMNSIGQAEYLNGDDHSVEYIGLVSVVSEIGKAVGR